MSKPKKSIKNQKYEEYWKLTLEYSDIFGIPFNKTLKMIIDFIDSNEISETGMNSYQYKNLQTIIMTVYPKSDMGSTRKSINQFFKLGFINNQGRGYHKLVKKFLNSNSENEKRRFFSKIMYENASFERSYSKFSNKNEINFFVKTLAENNKLSKKDIMTLIYTKVENFPKGYLTRKELDLIKQKIDENKFSERKYNQHTYITKMFTHLTDIYSDTQKNFYIDESFIDEKERKVRDSYLQRLYKLDLMDESKLMYGKAICYMEKVPYPVLIASHIKPFIVSKDSEEYDIYNGLLLSRNMDSLFDLGYISFDSSGKTIYSSQIDLELIAHIETYRLDDAILNDKRKEYLSYHRENVFRQ